MEYRILGPVDLWRDGHSVSVVGQKQRTLLAVLVLNANHVVSHDRLLAALWGTDLPATGRKLLHNHLWSLRRLLSTPVHLSGTPTGYRLHVPPGGADLAIFTAGVRAARTSQAAGDVQRAAEQFREALTLWRGSALAGTRDELMLTQGAALDELRIAALADRIEADLAVGRHADLISELRHLVTEHPLQERLRGHLMTALHRSGRTAEALEEYRIGRHHLRQELGLDPGQELTSLHQEILRAAPAKTGPSPAGATDTTALRRSVTPRQLPADIVRFTGREDDMHHLDRLLSGEPGAVTMAVVTGAPGIGKTALATRWGHRHEARFPDGQLYIDLHGYSPGEPATAMQALHQLLHGLGVAQDAIPHGMGEKETLYRSLLADRRLLLVLDNAARADQIRPLLPGGSRCKVVITSRDSLRGLVTTHDVYSVVLDVLSAEEAMTLLASILGEERVSREMDAAKSLARLCGHLPLALRLAAAHLWGQPDMPIGDFLAAFLADDPLSVLEIEGDPGVGVRHAFELSYQGLTETCQRTFRMMGLHPGPNLGVDELLVMTEESRNDIDSAVDALIRAHLVHRDGNGRYFLHDLVWLFARELSHAHDGEQLRHDALFRLFDWLLHASRAAMDQVYMSSLNHELKCSPPVHDVPVFDGFAPAAAWLELRYPMLMSVIQYAGRHGYNAHAWQLVETLDYFFYLRNQVDDWLASLRLALEAVRVLSDRDGEGRVLNALGMALLMAGRVRECIEYQQQALNLSRVVGDPVREAYALYRIGYSRLWNGDFRQSMADNLRAVDLYRQLGNERGEILATVALGIVNLRMGRSSEALSCLRRCLDYDRANGNRSDEGYTLTLLGDVYDELGDSETALDCYERAFRLNGEIGQTRFEAGALNGIGRVYRKQGRLAESAESHLRALALIRDGGDRTTECEILLDLGHYHLAGGDALEALRNCRLALEIADEITDRFLQGLTHRAVAGAHHALGQPSRAEHHLREALSILAPMGVPQAEDVAKRLP
ncbi:AfsR/SARP family transcriptional regulator [Nonomuraea diastatica]|uniref:Tetratricopeptide repeat protein n=1 Tax=Nonomuraea diastatica TaxID=1848329 RepID=A0A4R4WKR6_9ACTN|nr:BTAD domain-containing putative transcriptional regulator [Nonomuraea diastatica]TDD19878.1 tetratricopeptide repeat protein [Nonomuraea diastatica]